ncbi:hypothetical protein DPMN_104957 [Dreissena polymorpha]|uniref:Uncharacterized protein n=1 Tax=Dreissena polymorpha TaxID=45954 RepID=A0A9D4HBF4_DREPO|nr:hypothetical protein DPMN_104957 [Dreissena polymorpha]
MIFQLCGFLSRCSLPHDAINFDGYSYRWISRYSSADTDCPRFTGPGSDVPYFMVVQMAVKIGEAFTSSSISPWSEIVGLGPTEMSATICVRCYIGCLVLERRASVHSIPIGFLSVEDCSI